MKPGDVRRYLYRITPITMPPPPPPPTSKVSPAYLQMFYQTAAYNNQLFYCTRS